MLEQPNQGGKLLRWTVLDDVSMNRRGRRLILSCIRSGKRLQSLGTYVEYISNFSGGGWPQTSLQTRAASARFQEQALPSLTKRSSKERNSFNFRFGYFTSNHHKEIPPKKFQTQNKCRTMVSKLWKMRTNVCLTLLSLDQYGDKLALPE